MARAVPSLIDGLTTCYLRDFLLCEFKGPKTGGFSNTHPRGLNLADSETGFLEEPFEIASVHPGNLGGEGDVSTAFFQK